MRVAVNTVQHAGAWHWFGAAADTGRLILWDSTRHVTQNDAAASALAFHDDALRDGRKSPYEGAFS